MDLTGHRNPKIIPCQSFSLEIQYKNYWLNFYWFSHYSSFLVLTLPFSFNPVMSFLSFPCCILFLFFVCFLTVYS